MIKLRKLKSKIKIPEDDINLKAKQLYPIIGYLWLLFTFLVSYPSNLIPFQIFNPEWEFQTMTKLINMVWAPTIGFCLIFFHRKGSMRLWEKKMLGLLSWLTLLMAIAYFLMLPLIFADVNRIQVNMERQFNAQWEATNAPIIQIEEQLKKATPQQIEEFIKNQPINQKLDPKLSIEEKRERYLYALKTEKDFIYNSAQKQLKIQTRQKEKESYWLMIGAVISSMLMLNIWRFSNWTRQRYY